MRCEEVSLADKTPENPLAWLQPATLLEANVFYEPFARCFRIFCHLSGISCGAPPQVIPMPPPSDERKIHHTPSR